MATVLLKYLTIIFAAVEATEIAFSAAEVVVKQRKRGMTDPTREDAVLVLFYVLVGAKYN